MGTTARRRRQAGTHTVWIELDYDGAEPPTALFADLTMLGWHPPALASPPHHAIDWSVPDRVRGLDYTLRPWRVVGASVGPPAGSGPRGAWTEADAARLLPVLERVLQRHGVQAATTDQGAHDPAPEHDPAPRSDAGAASSAASVVASFVVEVEQAVAVRGLLEQATLPFRTSNATVSVAQRYRGREFTSEVAAVRFEVAVVDTTAADLREQLAALGVDQRLARLTIEPLEPGGSDDPGLADVHPFRRSKGVA